MSKPVVPHAQPSLDPHQLAGILLTMLGEIRGTVSQSVTQAVGPQLGEYIKESLGDQLRSIIAEEVRAAVKDALGQGAPAPVAPEEAPVVAPVAAPPCADEGDSSIVPVTQADGTASEAVQTIAQEAAYQMAQEMAQQLGPYMVQNVAHEVMAQLSPLLHKSQDGEASEAESDDAGSGDYLDLIHLELVELLDRIHATKSEVASLRPSMGATDQITAATMELEAVIQATEQATSDILEAAEDLQTTVDRLRSPTLQISEVLGIAEHLEDSATNILMTCSFQDLTGQRITAAVNTLLYVEESLTRIVELWGITQGTADSTLMRNAPDDDRPDKELLHGPQMDGLGVSQDDIDKMFG